jgi:hypothetical protein
MGSRGLITILLIAAGLSVFAVTGCGSGGDSSSSSSGASSAADTTSASTGESGDSSESTDGETEEFTIPGGKSEAEYGEVASDSEREAASVVLAENLEARAEGDWAGQCASLNAQGIESIEGNPKNKGKGCAVSLEGEAATVPKKLLENPLEGEIDVLRVKGTKALALWHGKGNDYAMAMENENGQWKVAALLISTLPKPEPKSKAKNSEAAPQSKSETSTNSG